LWRADAMPAQKSHKKKIGKKQIIQAIQAAGRKLGRAPIQAEFVRMSGIEVRVIKRHFRWFPTAVRAAGLSQAGHKVKAADILQNWAEVVRRLGHIPTFREYGREGRYCTTVFQRRFGGWAAIGDTFLRF